MATLKRNYAGGKARFTAAPAWKEELAGKLIARADRTDELRLTDRTSRQEKCPFCNHAQHLPPLKVKKNIW